MGKSAYKASWEEEYDWLAPVKTDKHRAFCKRCKKCFRVDGSGVSQVKSHAKTHKEDRNQFKLRIDRQTVSLQKSLEVCSEDKVIQAEILQA